MNKTSPKSLLAACAERAMRLYKITNSIKMQRRAETDAAMGSHLLACNALEAPKGIGHLHDSMRSSNHSL